MAVYDDYDGVWATVQGLRLFHADVMQDVELIVVDNNPDSPDGKLTKNLIGWMRNDPIPARYIPYTDIIGTAAPRNQVFIEASSENVMCIDPHIFIAPGAIKKLIDFYDSLPDPRSGWPTTTPPPYDEPSRDDLFSGPMLYDDLRQRATHFANVWRGEMWGTWATDHRGDPNSKGRVVWYCPCGLEFTVEVNRNGGSPECPTTPSPVAYYYLPDGSLIDRDKDHQFGSLCPRCGKEFPFMLSDTNDRLLEHGFTKYRMQYTGEPFEIGAMGLGLFTCRKDAWLGFNENFRGFGGEEWYIHEKFRKAGRKCWCLPWLGWPHRFGRSGGPKYRLDVHDKVRNYVIGHNELGIPLDRVKAHFVDGVAVVK
jgi:hypothetical protein